MAQAGPIRKNKSAMHTGRSTVPWTPWGFVPVPAFRTDVDAKAIMAALGKTRLTREAGLSRQK